MAGMDPQDAYNLQKAVDDINAQIAQGYLSLNRDIYANITLPQYRDVTVPAAYGGLTGFTPPDYRGPYAGRPTFGALEGSAQMMGRVGTDPRWAEMGYQPGDLTSGGALNLANTRAIDASREQLVRGAEMSQANKDRQYAMEINADPNSIVAGQILPDWLKPHAEWARQFVQQNGGRLPRYDELATTLKGFGRTPQDYLPGGQFYGSNSNATVQTLNQGAPVAGNPNTTPFGSPGGSPPGQPQAPGAGPVAGNAVGQLNTAYQGLIKQLGVPYLSYNDPRLTALYQQYLGGDQATALKRAQAASDWSRQHPGQTLDPETQRALYESAGAAAAPAPYGGLQEAGPGGMLATPNGLGGRGPMVQGGPAAVRQGGPLGQGASVPGRGPMARNEPAQLVQGGPYMMQQLGPSDRSAQGGPTMQTQPAMMQELGGGAEVNPAVARYGIEPWQRGGGGGGDLNYGGSGYTAGIGRGQAMGFDQRNLIERGRQFDVAQQFQHQGQQADIALRALQQESQLRADPFQLAQYRSGLGQTGIPGVIDAVAGRGVLPGVQGGQGQAPQRPTLGNQIGQVNQPTFGQASADQQAQALGPLSQINARNYQRAGPGGQSYVNSAYRYAGQAGSNEEVADAARRALPQFARRGVPTFGRYAA